MEELLLPEGHDEGYFRRELDEGWREYKPPNGRCYYWHSPSGKVSWKPPRKLNNPRSSSTLSLSSEPSTNIGNILKFSNLYVAVLRLNASSVKKKWRKSLVVLTPSLLFFRDNKIFDEVPTKVYLSEVILQRNPKLSKRKNVFSLEAKDILILVHSKDSVECESWYHAIYMVNETLRSQKSGGGGGGGGGGGDGDGSGGGGATRGVGGVLKRPNSCIIFPDSLSLPKKTSKSFQLEKKSSFPSKVKFPTPPGWTSHYDYEKECFVYKNIETGEKWCAERRKEGGMQFVEERSRRISLLLPTGVNTSADNNNSTVVERRIETDV